MTRPTDIAGLRRLHQAHHKCSLAQCDHYVDWLGCAEFGGLLDELETTRRERDINAGAFDAQHHWHVRAEEAEAKVAELEREVERLRRLEPFAAHREGCLLGKLAAIEANGDRSYHPCTCGLDAARRGVDHGR